MVLKRASLVPGNLEKLGVRSYSATEIVMGGEMAGMVVIGFGTTQSMQQ